MRLISLAAASAVAISLMASGASAAWTSSVTGKVVDVKTMQPVDDATIRIYTENGSQVMGKATSDASGAFSIGGLRGGQYRLEFDKKGFQRTLVLGVVVRPAEKYIEAAPIAMYPDGMKVPNTVAHNPCGGLVNPTETADVYVVCSEE